MKLVKHKKKVFILGVCFLFLILTLSIHQTCYAQSDSFLPSPSVPALTSYVSGGELKHTYYISTSGDDTSGNGSISRPWRSFKGATSGGAGTPVGAGDLIYFRGGTYTPNANTSWMEADSELHRSGTSSNYIVVTAYPGETPIMTSSHGVWSHSLRGNYIVIDGLTFGDGGNFLFYSCSNVVFRNNTFNAGSGEDGWGDQINGTQLGSTNSNYVTVTNNYFGDTTQHAIKQMNSGAVGDNWTIQYNRFYNNSCGMGMINQKGSASTWDFSYNRVETVPNCFRIGQHYGQAESRGLNIHHNVFDNVKEIIFQEDHTYGLNLYSNIVLNATGTTVFHIYCSSGASGPLGEVYDNAFYDITDLILCQGSGYTNYPSYFNYNAEASTTVRDTAENRNSLSSSSWQGSDFIQASHGITRTGTAGNRFYTVGDASGFRGRGRYGDSIGGFTWGNAPRPPSAPSGLRVIP